MIRLCNEEGKYPGIHYLLIHNLIPQPINADFFTLPLVCRLGSKGNVNILYLFAVVFVLTFVDEKYPAMTIGA